MLDSESQATLEFGCCGCWICRAGDRGGDGDAMEAGCQDSGQMFQRNPADREGGQWMVRGRLMDFVQEGGADVVIERLGVAGKDRSTTDVVGSVFDRIVDLIDRVSGDSHESLRADDLAGFAGGQFVLADMNPVGVGRDREIRTIIDDEDRTALVGDGCSDLRARNSVRSSLLRSRS